ncbi:MAG TPA: hypothetical protein PKA35_11860, partial [Paracoccus solventivorans]|uniref:hypothetical protein n=1 Tax=Paracoccus solventivorans TaxID=53463 RepID=UPI002B8F27DD
MSHVLPLAPRRLSPRPLILLASLLAAVALALALPQPMGATAAATHRPSSAPASTAQLVPPAHAPQASARPFSAPVRALSMKITCPDPRSSASTRTPGRGRPAASRDSP